MGSWVILLMAVVVSAAIMAVAEEVYGKRTSKKADSSLKKAAGYDNSEPKAIAGVDAVE